MTIHHRFVAIVVQILAPILLLLVANSAWAAECDAPAATVRPGTAAGVSGSATAFAGTWQGQWPVAAKGHVEPICARLYVQVISPAAATVEQCTGSNAAARRHPECKRYTAEVSRNVMTFTDTQGTVYTFTVADVGGMEAEAVNAAHRSGTVFTKVQ
jgi:hypothetical protein